MKNILIVMPQSYGDLFMITGIAKGLIKKQEANVFLMAKKQYIPYYAPTNVFKGIIEFEDSDTPDSIISKYGKAFDCIYFPYAETQLTKHYWEAGKHAVVLYANSCDLDETDIELPYMSPKESKIIKLPEEFVVVQGNSTFPCKSYEKIGEVVSKLKESGKKVVQVGSSSDKKIESVDLFLSSLPLETLQWVLTSSEGFIGPDSFVGHVSAALNKPTIITFGSTSSNLWHPFWGDNFKILKPEPRICNNPDGCFAIRCFLGKDVECQNRIPVETVLQSFKELCNVKN